MATAPSLGGAVAGRPSVADDGADRPQQPPLIKNLPPQPQDNPLSPEPNPIARNRRRRPRTQRQRVTISPCFGFSSSFIRQKKNSVKTR